MSKPRNTRNTRKAKGNVSKLILAQLMNYQRATGIKVGLLVNFSQYIGVEHKRFVI